MNGKKKFPIPNIVYSTATKGAGWFHLPFSTGKNKEILDKLSKELA